MAHESSRLHERAGSSSWSCPCASSFPLASVLLDSRLARRVQRLFAPPEPFELALESSRCDSSVAATRVSPIQSRSNARPLDDLAPCRGRRAGGVLLPAGAHPAGVEVERTLGELEGGRAPLFPSGSGAATALLLASSPAERSPWRRTPTRNPGPHADARRLGLRLVEFDQTGIPPDEADLVRVESPSNCCSPPHPMPQSRTRRRPSWTPPPRPRLPAAARARGGPSCRTATKFLGGHHDVPPRRSGLPVDDDYERSKTLRGRLGIVAAPDPAAPRQAPDARRHDEDAAAHRERDEIARFGWMPLQRWSECAIRALEG